MLRLPVADKTKLELLRKTNKDKKIYIKVTTLLLLDQGYGPTEIGQILGINTSTVERYEKDYSALPLEEFLSTNYVGKAAYLSAEQLSRLETELNTYLYLTVAEIRQFVFHTFGIEYSKEGIRDLLRRMKFRYKKTRTRPSRANPVAQQDWVAEFEQQLGELSENQEIYFCDAVHPMHNTRPDYGWIKRGKDYEIPANSGRHRLNINGAVNVLNPEVIFAVEAERISYESNMMLFEKMLASRPGKQLIVYVDNAKYNHAVALKEWIAKQNGRIEVRYLPTYSPNLNPIERLWKFMKKEVINSHYYESFAEFRTGVLDFFKEIKTYSHLLKTLITPKFQVFA